MTTNVFDTALETLQSTFATCTREIERLKDIDAHSKSAKQTLSALTMTVRDETEKITKLRSDADSVKASIATARQEADKLLADARSGAERIKQAGNAEATKIVADAKAKIAKAHEHLSQGALP